MRKRIVSSIHLIEILCILFFVLIIATTVGTYVYFAHTLVSKDKIMNNNDTGVILLDRNKKPFFTFYEGKNKEFVPLSQVSPKVLSAVVAAEDKEFYEHNGISFRGISRSIIKDIQEKNLAFGGSTITQQLVKNALLNSRKSFLRKYQEMVLAREIERRFSKREILEMYLNSVYFGEGAFGIQEASRRYFGKDASNMTLSEASFLAGVLPAPSYFSPYNGGLEKALKRQKVVLGNMKSLGFIKDKEYKDALSQKLEFKASENGINSLAPHFALMIKDFLTQTYGEEEITRRGLKVKTTLDLPIQEYAEKSVRRNVEKLTANGATNASAVVMDVSTREILGLVGSSDWYNSSFGKVNMAISPRQPGSSFKPIVYATAFEDGVITNATLLHDVPTMFHENGPNSPVYQPKDYDGKYRGIVSPRRALANSLNIPSVEVMSKLTKEQVLEEAKSLGITTLKDPSNYGLSLVLGAAEVPLTELTNVYASLANGGVSKTPITILSITDKNGNVLYKAKQKTHQVFSQQTAFLVTHILSDSVARREVFGNLLSFPIPAAIKTGTTENYRDAWTLGYTPYIAVGVWVGNNDGSFMDSVAGSLGAAPIWKELMLYASRDKPAVSFSQPEGIIAHSTCFSSGNRTAISSTSASMEYFVEGTEPVINCAPAASSSAKFVFPTRVPPPLTTPISNEGTSTSAQNTQDNEKRSGDRGRSTRGKNL